MCPGKYPDGCSERRCSCFHANACDRGRSPNMNIRLSETDHHPLGQTGTIGRVTEPCRSCRLLPSALCSARPVRRACSGELLVELHHLIRLDHHEKVRSEGTLSDSFIPFRASVWVHVLWSPAKHVCPLSYWRGRAEWVQLPVDCVCNYPRWSFASACRIYATLGLPRPGAHISGPR